MRQRPALRSAYRARSAGDDLCWHLVGQSPRCGSVTTKPIRLRRRAYSATPALRPGSCRSVRRSDRSRARTPRLHRRDLDRHQHDPQSRPLPQRQAAADGLPARASQDYHAGRWPARCQRGCGDGARRTDQWRLVRSLCRAGAGAPTTPRRRRRHGQPLQQQASFREAKDRSSRGSLRFRPP